MFDILVIGGGNAALCAALTAREAGASVCLLESAPFEWRGGNSTHTRNIRCMHDEPQDVLLEVYSADEYWQDLLKVTGGITDEKLAKIAIRESSTCRTWMRKYGVHFQAPLSGTLHLDILIYDGCSQNDMELTLPHPRITERSFVLLPLLEICPELFLPEFGILKAFLPQVAHQRIDKLPCRNCTCDAKISNNPTTNPNSRPSTH